MFPKHHVVQNVLPVRKVNSKFANSGSRIRFVHLYSICRHNLMIYWQSFTDLHVHLHSILSQVVSSILQMWTSNFELAYSGTLSKCGFKGSSLQDFQRCKRFGFQFDFQAKSQTVLFFLCSSGFSQGSLLSN